MPVERNKEIVRQWKVLQQIASQRDCTVAKLARDHEVCARTMYRDLAALQAAGFPLYQEPGDGCQYWRLTTWPFRNLHDASFTFPELCAFYINRGALQAAATGLEEHLASALAKVTKDLSPQMRRYLDRLQEVFGWKTDPKPVAGRGKAVAADALVQATLDHRKIQMEYYSHSSGRVKSYEVEPYRLAAGNGGLYVYAFVPAYGQMRTFAVQRIRKLRVLEATFDPVEERAAKVPFEDSIGIGSGTPKLVEIAFDPRLAPYIEERTWHETQQVTRQPDGGIVLSMRVAVDVPLRTWILGFGHKAQVLAPSSLAAEILEELEEAREQYAPKMKFELPPAIYGDHPQLPFYRVRPAAKTPARGHGGAGRAGSRPSRRV